MLRCLAAVLVLASVGVLAATASSATVDPRLLVLRRADVPAGFKPHRSDVLTNAEESAGQPKVAAFFRRTGRITGFETVFETEGDRNGPSIESRAELFRRAAGARNFLLGFDSEMKLSGVRGLRRTPANIGAQGWVYSVDSSSGYTLVAWRYGRIVGGVLGLDISRPRTVALARAQQRRIAAALG